MGVVERLKLMLYYETASSLELIKLQYDSPTHFAVVGIEK